MKKDTLHFNQTKKKKKKKKKKEERKIIQEDERRFLARRDVDVDMRWISKTFRFSLVKR
jgi:hypothetical protein